MSNWIGRNSDQAYGCVCENGYVGNFQIELLIIF